MLKNDEPKGTPIGIWFDIYNEHNITYCAIPKKHQKNFQKERAFRQTLRLLTKKTYIKPVPTNKQKFSLTHQKRYGYNFYILTNKGRLTAEKINQKITNTEKLQKILNQLQNQGHKYVTITQIRNNLWQTTTQNFTNKKEFEKYWNNTKIGLMLQKHVIIQGRIGFKDRRQKYYFKPDPQF